MATTVTREIHELVIDFTRPGGPHMWVSGRKMIDEDGEKTQGQAMSVERQAVKDVQAVEAFTAWALTKIKQKMGRTDIVFTTPPEAP